VDSFKRIENIANDAARVDVNILNTYVVIGGFPFPIHVRNIQPFAVKDRLVNGILYR
jgi:hypothetical protein